MPYIRQHSPILQPTLFTLPPLATPPIPLPATGAAKDIIILLDLNYTLVADSWRKRKSGGPYASLIPQETYRRWLIELVDPYYVILVTVRSHRYERITLATLENKTGWQPDAWYFNPTPPQYRGDIIKRRYLRRHILPRHGHPRQRPYFAIESLIDARRMYLREFGIHSCRADDCRRGIPFQFSHHNPFPE